jgi:CRP-like cAMP-binding protein
MSSLEKGNPGLSSEFSENLDFLRQTYLFSVLPLESLKIFAYLCTRIKLKAGEFLFRQGEDDGQAAYILSGRAVVERGDGNAGSEIRTLGPGEFIGGLTLLGASRRLYSLRAVEDLLCIVLQREKFTKAIRQFPEQMPRVFRAVVGAVEDWEERFLTEVAHECGGCLPKLGVSLL